MKKIYDTLKNNTLFSGINQEDFEKMVCCLSAKVVEYKKDDIILLSGEKVNSIGLVLRGAIKIISEDIDGNLIILARLSVSEIFAEVFVCAGVSHSPVTVQAAEDCEIIFLNYSKIIKTCTAVCGFHSKLIENMLKLIACKTLSLNSKIEILSRRTIRDKLLLFFDMQQSKKFSIPYNREELARYLCVDRSALSNELSKMRNEGLILFEKNLFQILF